MAEFNTDFVTRAARVDMPTVPRAEMSQPWGPLLDHFIDAVKREQSRRYDIQTDYNRCRLPEDYFPPGSMGNTEDRPFTSPDLIPFIIWIGETREAGPE